MAELEQSGVRNDMGACLAPMSFECDVQANQNGGSVLLPLLDDGVVDVQRWSRSCSCN